MDDNRLLATLLSRRSVSPKRLRGPGPNPDELKLIVDAALRAPDHGNLRPWRLIEFETTCRAALAALFADEKRRRDPVSTPEDLARAREHATHAPTVLAFVVRAERHVLVPIHEQWLSAGAALGNLLLAVHSLGYGAIMLSGERCQDPALCTALGLQTHETLAGFISIGAVTKAPPPVERVERDRVFSSWQAAVEPTTVDME
jgi:nitroreductase